MTSDAFIQFLFARPVVASDCYSPPLLFSYHILWSIQYKSFHLSMSVSYKETYRSHDKKDPHHAGLTVLFRLGYHQG